MARGRVTNQYPYPCPHHPNLAVVLAALEAGPLDMAQHGISYKTVFGLLHSPKDPTLRTAHLCVSALRQIAVARNQAGKSSVPLETITVDTVFPLSRLPSTLRAENINQAPPKSNS